MNSDKRVWFGRLLTIAVVGLLVAAPFAAFAQCTVKDGCPLPKKFLWKDAGTPGPKGSLEMDNATDKTAEGLKETVCNDNVDSDLDIIKKDSPGFEIKENDEELKVDFDVPFDQMTNWKKDAKDCTATATTEKMPWSPLEKYHEAFNKAANKVGDEQFPYPNPACWKKGGKWTEGNHKWLDDPFWYIDKAAHAYHYDGPTHYGTKGGVGDNDQSKEGEAGDAGFAPKPMKYVVPSVPYMYMISSVMTAQWKWGKNAEVTNEHEYINIHTKADDKLPLPYGDGKCDICGAPAPGGPEKGTVKIKIEGKKPEDFYNGDVVVTTPEKPPETIHCPKGVSAQIYDPETGLSFALPDQDADICRATVRVLDTKRETLVSFGDGSDAVWKTETGKKVTETDGHKVQFSMYDNAPHMRYKPVVEEQLVKQGEDWDVEKNFKAIFWYEDMIYDYAGISNPALGLGEVFYTPKIYLKEGSIWEGVDGFTRFTKDEKTNACKDGDKGDPANPQYLEWILEFDTKELFEGEKNGEKEDIATLHYCDKALGDQFGGPRWEQGDYDGEKFNSYEGICDKVENKPISFIKGRGPLKCFFEITQCSSKDESTGGGHKEFLADGKQYFFPNDLEGKGKYQSQVVFNPTNVKHIQEPAAKSVAGGSDIDPTQGNGDLKKTDYGDVGDNWSNNAEIKGGGDKSLFQKFGRIEITDKRRPNVGLRVYNKSSQKYRDIYYKNSIDKLSFYDGLKGSGTKATLRNDDDQGDIQYADDADTWKFENSPADLNQGEDEFTPPDKGQGYGLFEDVDLEMSHNDLKNVDKHGSVLCFYAHDNIDGQRMKYSKEVPKDYFYKGLETDGNEREKFPSSAMGDVYANNRINEGYKSWLVFDNSYSEPKMLEYYRPDGNNFIYPNICFHNPNVKAGGGELNAGASDVHVSYMVHDRSGNSRKFRLTFFVKAIDVNINTLERHDQKQ